MSVFPVLHIINPLLTLINNLRKLTSGWVTVTVLTVVFFPSWIMVRTEVEVEVDITGFSQTDPFQTMNEVFSHTCSNMDFMSCLCHTLRRSRPHRLPNRGGSHINPVSNAFYEQLKTFYNRQATNYDIILSSLVQLCESNERVEQNSYKSELDILLAP